MDRKVSVGKPAKESTLATHEVVVVVGRLYIGRVLGYTLTIEQQ
jgi:hypothetical protein